jgi:hypothetical protein
MFSKTVVTSDGKNIANGCDRTIVHAWKLNCNLTCSENQIFYLPTNRRLACSMVNLIFYIIVTVLSLQHYYIGSKISGGLHGCNSRAAAIRNSYEIFPSSPHRQVRYDCVFFLVSLQSKFFSPERNHLYPSTTALAI